MTTDTYAAALEAALLARIEEIDADYELPPLDPIASMSAEEIAWRDEQNAIAARLEGEAFAADLETDGPCHVCDWPEASYVPGWRFPLCSVCHGEALLAEAAAEWQRERADHLRDQIESDVLSSWHHERESIGLPPFP